MEENQESINVSGESKSTSSTDNLLVKELTDLSTDLYRNEILASNAINK